MTGTDGIFLEDTCPRIGDELLETQGHLLAFTVESEHNGFDLVADLEEVVGGAQVLRPGHFGDMDKAFHAGDDLHESAVVGDDDHFTFDFVADFEIRIELLPRLRGELLETQGDTLLAFLEVEDDDVDLLVELDNLGGVADAAPCEDRLRGPKRGR